MQQQSEAITRPYLTINVFSEPHGVLYYLRIANTGKTVASNVRLTLDRDFYQLGQKHMPNLREASVFQQPIEQLPPGAEMNLRLGSGARRAERQSRSVGHASGVLD